jgi:hypothetical protein
MHRSIHPRPPHSLDLFVGTIRAFHVRFPIAFAHLEVTGDQGIRIRARPEKGPINHDSGEDITI